MRDAFLAAIEDGREEPTTVALKRLASQLETAGASYDELASLLMGPELDPTGEYAHTGAARVGASTVPDDLKQIYEQWSTEKLVRTLSQSEEFNPAAIPVMMRVLNARGVFGVRLEEVASEIRSEQEAEAEDFRHIRGWLLVFDFLMGAISLLFTIVSVVLFFSRLRAWPIGVLLFSLGLYGLYGLFLLVRVRPQARRHAHLWLVVLAAFFIGLGILAFITDTPLQAGPPLMVLFALISHFYLTRSRRVAQIYGSPLE